MYSCKHEDHEEEPIVGVCLSTMCQEQYFLFCAQCQFEKHLAHRQNCYSLQQIRKFLNKSIEKLDDLLTKSADDQKKDIETVPEIKKLLIMIQKIQLQDQKIDGLKEYIEQKIFLQGQFDKLHELSKSFENYEFHEDQQKIQETLNITTDSTSAAQCNKFYNSGKKYYENKDFYYSLECFDKLVHLDPQNSEAHLYKGCCLNNLQYYKEAIQCFDEVLRLDPHNFIALNNKGLALCLLDNLEEAMIWIDKALKLNPKQQLTLINKANALLNLEREEEALMYFEKAEQIGPVNFLFSQENDSKLLILTQQSNN